MVSHSRKAIEDTLADGGAELGGYRLVARLGAGAMGQVYSARPRQGGELVALKQITVFDPTHLYRFKQEFRALADIAHPNLVRLGELVVLASGLAFFTMERIEGESFSRWVRRRAPVGMPPNFARLTYALRQLALGVRHLHRAGRLHRDLKPSNVLVSSEGRVVILDFGLVFELRGSEPRITLTGQLLGTPAYLAPEQASHNAIGPAVDLYSIGVMLFECLTGCLPFGGTAARMVIDKQQQAAPEPGVLAPGIPAWLGRLCRGLLDPDAERRTTIDELLAALDEGELVTRSEAEPSRELELFGRERELELLERVHAQVVDEGGCTLVRLAGPRGRGKTALVDRFVQGVAESGAMILRGRCHPRESIPFEGVDGVVDALTLHLRALPDLEAAKLQPRRVQELCELFPVLAGVWRESGRRVNELDPVTRRRHAVTALREVLLRVSDTRPLVVFVDDFHWSDLDGLGVLAELMLPPDSPAMLVIVAFDPDAGGSIVGPLAEVDTFRGARVVDLELGSLDDAAARSMARVLLDGEAERVEALVEASAGEPLALVRGAQREGASAAVEVSDGELMRAIRSLDASARTLLELSVLLGEPLSRGLACALLEGGPAEAELAQTAIRQAGLAAAVAFEQPGSSLARALRIIELVRVELQTEREASLHLRIAEILAQADAEPERVAEHFVRAGERRRARACVRRGADAAAEALAFVRAARLYRRALGLLDEDETSAAELRELRLALAEQLVHLAHCREAAEIFVEVAKTSTSEEAAKLRLRAAEQYAISGWSEQALALLRDLLAAAGERMPSSALGAIATFVWNHLRLSLSRLLPRSRRHAPDPSIQVRFDLAYAASLATSRRHILMGAALIPRVLQLALESGDPARRIMALSIEVALLATLGRRDRARRLADRALELARDLDDPFYLAYAHACEYLGRSIMEVSAAEASFEQMMAYLDRCPGESWLRTPMLHRHSVLLVRSGAYMRMLNAAPGWLALLHATGQLQFEILLTCEVVIAQAQLGQCLPARRSCERARSRWCVDGYGFEDALLANADVWLLMGERKLVEAASVARAKEAEFLERGLRRIKLPRMRLRATTLYATLAAAIASDTPRAAPTPHELRGLRRCGLPNHAAEALILAAGRASLVGERERELQLWREASSECQAIGARGLAAAAARRLAELDVPDRVSLEAEAEAYFEAEGIGDPAHFVGMLAPAKRGHALASSDSCPGASPARYRERAS